MNSTNNSNGQPQQHNIGFAQALPEISGSHATDKAVAANQGFGEIMARFS